MSQSATTYSDEAYHEADDIINSLKSHTDVDYTPYRDEIARCFDEGLWQGNWDVRTDIGVPGVRDLRLIQEDEWDQHMDHKEDRPTAEKMLFLEGAYVWFADDTI